MAKSNFNTPEVRTFPVIPKLEDNATVHLSPFKSKEEFQKSLVTLVSLLMTGKRKQSIKWAIY